MKRSTFKRSTFKRSTMKRGTMKRSTLKRVSMKHRKTRAFRRKGGMFRRAATESAKKVFKEVFKGKNPVETVDKAKQVADAIAKGLATRSESTPGTPGTTPTFSTPNERMRIDDFNDFNDFDRSNSPIENLGLYKTPVKGKHSSGSDDSDDYDINPSKINRHQRRSVITPHSYAPRLNEPTSVVTGNLFDQENGNGHHLDEDDE